MKKVKTLELYLNSTDTNEKIPYADLGVKAGFPSPAQDYLSSLDLNKELIKNPASTYLAKVVGDSMIDVNLYDGDILVVDKSKRDNIQNGDMVVCSIDGEYTVKFIKFDGDIIWLMPANKKYQPIKVTADSDFRIWGVVVGSYIDRTKRRNYF